MSGVVVQTQLTEHVLLELIPVYSLTLIVYSMSCTLRP